MTNNIDWNDWETDNLTPLVFDKIGSIFHELNFTQVAGSWRSGIKLDGTQPTPPRRDKTVVKKNWPAWIIEQGERPRNIVKYYAETRNLEYHKARKELADIVGLELPKSNYTEQATNERKRRGILADTFTYFEDCLYSESQGAKDVLNYLTQTRGYSLELINKMNLGYIPSQKQLTEYLAKKYTVDEIKDAINFTPKIGDTHKLAITRISAGRVIGFNFRTIGDHTPKYLKPTGEELRIFINVPARIDNGDLIIVEGEIDSLHAKGLGFDNVVCVGRNDVNDEQLIDAQRRGFTSVTVCLDREPQKDAETSLKALKIGNQAQALGFDVFVMELPVLDPKKTDLDFYLTAKGENAIKEFKELITDAPSLATFKANNLFNKYADKIPLSDKDAISLRKELFSVGLTVNTYDLANFINRVADPLEGVIKFDKPVLIEGIEELQNEAKLHQAGKDLKKLLNDTAKSEGTIEQITQQLKKGLGEIEAKSTDLTEYLKANNWDEFITNLNATPQGLHTGYIQGESKYNPETKTEENELLIPNKAITIIAGRSGHGKTTAMVNLTLKLLEKNNHLKRVHFFTYEMPEEQLIERALLSFVGNGVGAMFSENPKRALHTLISKGNDQYIKREHRADVKSFVNQFRTEYIDTGRLTFRDARGKPIEEIRASVTALRKRGEIDAVVIDYIQKFTSNTVKGTTGTALMKHVTDELNGLANETDLPIITGAQFNRSVQYLHEVSELAIREADDITHVGALILGIWNNDANPTKLGARHKDASEDEITKTNSHSHLNTFYIEVLKNRFGQAGIGFNMAYNGKLQTLGNYLDGAGVIGIDEQTEAIQKPKLIPFGQPKAERLNITQQLNRIREVAKDNTNAGIDIEEGLQLFTILYPNITITEAHKIAYKGTHKAITEKLQSQEQRKAQTKATEERKQAKKPK
jgi:DNA primase